MQQLPILPSAFLLRPRLVRRSDRDQEIELKGWMPSEAIQLPFFHYVNIACAMEGLKFEIHGKRRSRRILFFKKITVRRPDDVRLHIEDLRAGFSEHLKHSLRMV